MLALIASAVEPLSKMPTLHTDQEIVAIAKRHLGRELLITGTLDELSKKNAMSITWGGFDRTLAELRKTIGLNPMKIVMIEGGGMQYLYFERLQVSPSYDLVMTFQSGRKPKPDAARPLKLTRAFFTPHKDEKYGMNISQPERWGKVLFGKVDPEEKIKSK
jgi:hypothetical protein